MLRRIDKAIFINAGSTGMAYDRTRGAPGRIRFAAWAEFAVLGLAASGIDVSLRRVALDREAVVAAFQSSGAPNVDWWTTA
jgi:hypothetical protein